MAMERPVPWRENYNKKKLLGRTSYFGQISSLNPSQTQPFVRHPLTSVSAFPCSIQRPFGLLARSSTVREQPSIFSKAFCFKIVRSAPIPCHSGHFWPRNCAFRTKSMLQNSYILQHFTRLFDLFFFERPSVYSYCHFQRLSQRSRSTSFQLQNRPVFKGQNGPVFNWLQSQKFEFCPVFKGLFRPISQHFAGSNFDLFLKDFSQSIFRSFRPTIHNHFWLKTVRDERRIHWLRARNPNFTIHSHFWLKTVRDERRIHSIQPKFTILSVLDDSYL